MDRVAAPLALFQGADDRVVPPNQAEAAYRALTVPKALVVFEGEGHGFRAAKNIRSAIEGELRFYGRTLGFDTGAWPDGLTEPEIVNLPPPAST
jgi:dipeptidyl aminopeptidase/acylaminoacyl peptidase